MRLIYLIITVALIWFLLDTYLDHAATPKTTAQSTTERAGLIDSDEDVSGSDPFFGREMEKARSVEDKLQDDVNRKLKEIDEKIKY